MSRSFEGYTEQAQQLDQLGDAQCTVAHLEQQLDQRDEQIAALRAAIEPWILKERKHTSEYEQRFFSTAFKATEAYDNTQAAAEAHNAKVKDAAVRECIELINKGAYKTDLFDAAAFFESELEALLSKEPG